jgi:DNA-binding Xre family transcriptional regulator
LTESRSPESDSDATDSEKQQALEVVVEAIFPGLATDIQETMESALRSKKGLTIRQSLVKEEAVFADRLAEAMRDRRISQTELAKRIGVQQSAISMMLKRHCRPQARTVLRLAEALSVSPEDLWPGFVHG